MNFKLGDRVTIKSMLREGFVVEIYWVGSQPTEYKVRYEEPWYYGGPIDSYRSHMGPNTPRYATVYEQDLELVRPIELKTKLTPADVLTAGTLKTCECGMEKHGFANHSNWCPKAER